MLSVSNLKVYNTRSWKLACKGLELRRVSIFCKKDYIHRSTALLYRLQNLGDRQGLPSLFRLTSLVELASNPLNTHFKRPLCVKGAVTVGDWGIACYA